MKRRTMLAGGSGALLGGFPGCTSLAGLGGSNGTGVSVGSVADLSEYGMEFDVEVVRSELDGSEPPAVRLILRHISDKSVDFGEWEDSLINNVCEDTKVKLYPKRWFDEHDFESGMEHFGVPDPSDAGCWLTHTAAYHGAFPSAEGDLEEEGWAAQTYVILGLEPTLEQMCPSGEYVWRAGYPFTWYESFDLSSPDDERRELYRENVEVMWEFSLAFP